MAKLQNMRGLQVPGVCLMPSSSLLHTARPDETMASLSNLGMCPSDSCTSLLHLRLTILNPQMTCRTSFRRSEPAAARTRSGRG